jgi:hypothetical protein
MTRWILVLFISITPAFAQTQFGAGASVGTQFFEDSSTGFVGSVDGLFEIKRAGLHLAGDVTNQSAGGMIRALHLDGTWRNPLGDDYSFMFGAGLTLLDVEAGYSDTTWNVEVELARRFARVDGYLRLRHYDYSFNEFRGYALSPAGPGISFGARYKFQRAPNRSRTASR